MTQLSQHFHLREFTRSQTATRLGRPVEASAGIIASLRRLCVEVLEPIRVKLGPVIITSGYRPEWLNERIGGSNRSDHVHGRAADIEVQGMTAAEAAKEIEAMGLPIKQLILEYPPDGWIHVSIPEEAVEPRRELLTAVRENGKTVYWPGLHA